MTDFLFFILYWGHLKENIHSALENDVKQMYIYFWYC